MTAAGGGKMMAVYEFHAKLVVEGRLDRWVARAEGFPAFAYGRSEEEAVRRLHTALDLLGASLGRDRKLAEFLDSKQVAYQVTEEEATEKGTRTFERPFTLVGR